MYLKTEPDPEPRPQPIRPKMRPEAAKRANVTSQAKEEKPARSLSEPGNAPDTCVNLLSMMWAPTIYLELSY